MQQPTPRRLTKGHDRMIGGVASGFAEYFNLDPTLVRIGFVLTGLVAAPAALFGYLLFLVIMPPPGDTSTGATPTASGAANSANLLGIVLLAIGGMLLFGVFWSGIWSWGFMPHMWGGDWSWPARFIWPVIIILVALFLLTRNRPR